MTAAHYKGGHPPGNDLGLHYTALPPIVASCPYSDQLLVTRKFWSPGANRPSQASGRATHGGIDALQRLMREEGVTAEQVVACRFRVPPLTARLIGRPITKL